MRVHNFFDSPDEFGRDSLFLLPVLEAFGDRPVHRFTCETRAGWDWKKILAAEQKNILRADTQDLEGETSWRHVLLAAEGSVFHRVGKESLTVLAPTRSGAEQAAAAFFARYEISKPTPAATYQLISREFDFETKEVALDPSQIPSPGDLDLLYGPGFSEWCDELLRRLAKPCGLTLLDGPPGTGKTTFLRHIISVLHRSHRFYFIPPVSASAITEPEFVSFWQEQHESHKDQQFVCVFEDAEGSLMTREADNRHKVEAILGMTDGLLADFLKLQVICTFNCGYSDIDPALLRPGRLLAKRVFHRLPPDQARRIAEKFRCPLPTNQPDYSLAEIFNAGESPVKPRPVGFAKPE